jgi:succinate dehydrogenase/fumarate reductase flavoprotein subunit
MQAAVTPQDSPSIHYLDAIGGGHFDNKPDLVRALTEDGPEVVKWLEELGVVWDKNPDGSMYVLHGGGTSRKRMHSCRDYTGAIIMRTLMDEVRNHPDKVTVLEFMPAVELLLDEKGRCAGGVLYNLETEEYFTVKAKAVLITTGGVHGRNRLMGNSVLDYNVFGRRAGIYAAEYVKTATLGKLSLEHINAYEAELKKAGIKTDRVAPVLLPSYTPQDVRRRQLTAHYEGTLR